MYNQVKGPFETMDNVKLPEAWFQKYLLKSQVRIIHLVREGVILRLASTYQTGMRRDVHAEVSKRVLRGLRKP